ASRCCRQSPSCSSFLLPSSTLSSGKSCDQVKVARFLPGTQRARSCAVTAPGTRAAYYRAVCSFFRWLEARHVHELGAIRSHHVTGYVYYDIPVPYVGLQLFGGVGYQYVDDDYNGIDWRLGATVTVKGVDFSVAYTDTDYRASECGNNQCNAKVVFTVGMEF
ncbi:MAG: TorF family putative porin, partial [Rhodoplanes sp.]